MIALQNAFRLKADKKLQCKAAPTGLKSDEAAQDCEVKLSFLQQRLPALITVPRWISPIELGSGRPSSGLLSPSFSSLCSRSIPFAIEDDIGGKVESHCAATLYSGLADCQLQSRQILSATRLEALKLCTLIAIQQSAPHSFAPGRPGSPK